MDMATRQRTNIATRLFHRLEHTPFWGDYDFSRAPVNDYGEPTDDIHVVCTISACYLGLSQYESQYTKALISISGTTPDMHRPMMVCHHGAAAQLLPGDTTAIDGNTYAINDVTSAYDIYDLISLRRTS